MRRNIAGVAIVGKVRVAAMMMTGKRGGTGEFGIDLIIYI